MRIFFENKKLAKTFNDEKEIRRKYGRMSNKIMLRLTQLRAAPNLEALRHAPGRYHELREDRKGQIACTLKEPYRLIFKPANNPVPVNEQGQLIWEQITEIIIIEIKNYHKKN